MPRLALPILSVSALALTLVFADQPDPAGPTPLVDKHYSYPGGLPYQVYPDDPETTYIRGPQTGYNICNATTQNQKSLCQTSMVNHLDDFCLWGPPEPGTIGDNEGEVVVWCTKSGYGTRLVPLGALQGVQLLRTSLYIQIAGFIDEIQINVEDVGDQGELDPHGPDQRGNPIGGLMYSNAFPGNAGRNDTFQQAIEWNSFIGKNSFCITICDPMSTTSDQNAYCDHKYDRIGCPYNSPNNAQIGVFEVCDSDLKTRVGQYINQDGYTLMWSQPSTGPASPPYTPTVPSSSNCFTYQSTDLYGPTQAAFKVRAAQTPTPAPGNGSPAAPTPTDGSRH